MFLKPLRGTLVIFISFILSGCAAVPPVVSQGQLSNPAAIKHFELNGRIGIQHQNEGFSGNLHWQHQGLADEIQIYGPLGQMVVHIIKLPKQGVRLITSDRKEYSAADVETLTESIVGWRLPLQGLQYWVLGAAHPDSYAEIKRDDQQRPIQLFQSGWQVEIQRYQAESGLPDKLVLRYGDSLQIRLVIDRWSINPE